MVPFSNGRWTLYSEVIKKDEYDESVHTSIVGLSCPTPPTERGIMRVPDTMWTHQRGQVLNAACHK